MEYPDESPTPPCPAPYMVPQVQDLPWIKYRSKSHSGRPFYYNTLTRESVWNLSEEDLQKARLLRGSISELPLTETDSLAENCPQNNVTERTINNQYVNQPETEYSPLYAEISPQNIPMERTISNQYVSQQYGYPYHRASPQTAQIPGLSTSPLFPQAIPHIQCQQFHQNLLPQTAAPMNMVQSRKNIRIPQTYQSSVFPTIPQFPNPPFQQIPSQNFPPQTAVPMNTVQSRKNNRISQSYQSSVLPAIPQYPIPPFQQIPSQNLPPQTATSMNTVQSIMNITIPPTTQLPVLPTLPQFPNPPFQQNPSQNFPPQKAAPTYTIQSKKNITIPATQAQLPVLPTLPQYPQPPFQQFPSQCLPPQTALTPAVDQSMEDIRRFASFQTTTKSMTDRFSKLKDNAPALARYVRCPVETIIDHEASTSQYSPRSPVGDNTLQSNVQAIENTVKDNAQHCFKRQAIVNRRASIGGETTRECLPAVYDAGNIAFGNRDPNYDVQNMTNIDRRKKKVLTRAISVCDLRMKLLNKKREREMIQNAANEMQTFNVDERPTLNSPLDFSDKNIIASAIPTENSKIIEENDRKWIEENSYRNATTPLLDLTELKKLARCFNSELLFIVPDTNVCMLNSIFLQALVNSDADCRLLLVQEVGDELRAAATCAGDAHAERLARSAVRVIDRLMESGRALEEQTVLCRTIDSPNVDDQILSCCLRLRDNNYRLVFLTNDKLLKQKAQSAFIEAFKTKELQEFLTLYHRQTTKETEETPIVITINNSKHLAGTDTQNHDAVTDEVNELDVDDQHEIDDDDDQIETSSAFDNQSLPEKPQVNSEDGTIPFTNDTNAPVKQLIMTEKSVQSATVTVGGKTTNTVKKRKIRLKRDFSSNDVANHLNPIAPIVHKRPFGKWRRRRNSSAPTNSNTDIVAKPTVLPASKTDTQAMNVPSPKNKACSLAVVSNPNRCVENKKIPDKVTENVTSVLATTRNTLTAKPLAIPGNKAGTEADKKYENRANIQDTLLTTSNRITVEPKPRVTLVNKSDGQAVKIITKPGPNNRIGNPTWIDINVPQSKPANKSANKLDTVAKSPTKRQANSLVPVHVNKHDTQATITSNRPDTVTVVRPAIPANNNPTNILTNKPKEPHTTNKPLIRSLTTRQANNTVTNYVNKPDGQALKYQKKTDTTVRVIRPTFRAKNSDKFSTQSTSTDIILNDVRDRVEKLSGYQMKQRNAKCSESASESDVSNGSGKLNLTAASRFSTTVPESPSAESSFISNSDAVSVLSENLSRCLTRSRLMKDALSTGSADLDESTFEVTCPVMKENLKLRCDEFLSLFFQIMEEVLSQILQHGTISSKVKISPPWTLHEATNCLMDIYPETSEVGYAANMLSLTLSSKIEDEFGHIRRHITPSEYMDMFRYGVNLVETISRHQALRICDEIPSALQRLSKLLEEITKPRNSATSVIFEDGFSKSNQPDSVSHPVTPAPLSARGSPNCTSRLQDQGLQDQGLQDQGLQDQGLQDQGLQDQGLQDQGLQDQGLQDQGFQDQGLQDQGLRDQGFQDQGLQDQGLQDQGFQDQGLQDQGFQDQGFQDQGFQDQGFQDQELQDQEPEKKQSPVKFHRCFNVDSEFLKKLNMQKRENEIRISKRIAQDRTPEKTEEALMSPPKKPKLDSGKQKDAIAEPTITRQFKINPELEKKLTRNGYVPLSGVSVNENNEPIAPPPSTADDQLRQENPKSSEGNVTDYRPMVQFPFTDYSEFEESLEANNDLDFEYDMDEYNQTNTYEQDSYLENEELFHRYCDNLECGESLAEDNVDSVVNDCHNDDVTSVVTRFMKDARDTLLLANLICDQVTTTTIHEISAETLTESKKHELQDRIGDAQTRLEDLLSTLNSALDRDNNGPKSNIKIKRGDSCVGTTEYSSFVDKIRGRAKVLLDALRNTSNILSSDL